MSTHTTTMNLWRNDTIPVEVTGTIYRGTNNTDDPTEVDDIRAVVAEDVPVYDQFDCPVEGALRFRKGEVLDLTEEEQQECADQLTEDAA